MDGGSLWNTPSASPNKLLQVTERQLWRQLLPTKALSRLEMSYARCQYWHPGKPLLRSLSSSHIWKILEVYGIIWKHGIFCWKSIVQIHTSNNPLQLDPRCLTVTTKPCHPGTHVDCFLAKAWLFCNAIASKDCHGGVGTWCQSPFTGELLKVPSGELT